MTDTRLQDAYAMHRAGKLAEAAELYGEVLKSEPRRYDVLYSLGLAHLQLGDFSAAERVLEEAAGADGNAAEAHMIHGVALSQLGRHRDALIAYDRAIALKADDASAWSNRGTALMQLGRLSEAVESYDRALRLRPSHADGWRHRGLALALSDRPEEALESAGKALALNPDLADALEDKAHLLMRLRNYKDAALAYAKAIAARPKDAGLYYNHANALSILKRHGEAIEQAKAALALDPDYPYARGVLVHSRLQSCDWRSLQGETAKVADGIGNGKRAISPFNHKAICDSPQEQLACARVWAKNERPSGIVPLTHARRGHERIKLAYVSADFNLSAVASIMAPIFERHDKDRFETIAISLGDPAPTPMRARLRAAFSCFIDARERSDAEIAASMADAGIDIAVDLMGYTGQCRPWILAHRPAPVQVNFLGFPGTMGVDHIDYIVADRTVIPEAAQIHYAEKIAYLPDSYLPGDGTRKISARPSRRKAGLPEEGFVFASFNNAYKFSSVMFDIWMRLLHAVPGCVLWLPESEKPTMANLAREAETRGISASRLVFAPLVPAPEEHLARLSLADLFLDTLPYNAHSTAIDALIAGVPVLTARGAAFQGRVAASLLTSAGLPELIAPDLSEYERMALHFARSPQSLAAMREKLARNRATAPLFDPERFTRHLESAFAIMWDRYRRGEAPASFAAPTP